jgi:transposase
MFRLEDGRRFSGRIIFVGGLLLYLAAALSSMIGCLPWDWWRCLHDCQDHSEYQGCHGGDIVTQKTSKQYLTNYNFCITFIPTREGAMANVLSKDKQIAVIGALAEGSSIRSIEQITGVHRDTIMRLAVRVGQGCATLLDKKMRNLSCQHLQLDEIWGFIGKKQRHVRPSDDPQYGDVWTFCAIDADTKLVPVFLSGYQAQ